MEYTAAVIRVEDDSVFDGGSEEVALALRALLEKDGWTIKNVSTVPSDFDRIKGELVRCSYDLGCAWCSPPAVPASHPGILPRKPLWR